MVLAALQEGVWSGLVAGSVEYAIIDTLCLFFLLELVGVLVEVSAVAGDMI
jgi:hypothetical protein